MKQLLRFLAFLLVATPAGAAAQGSDSGVLLIRAGDREVGMETFSVVADSGVRISTRAVYSGVRPPVELTVSLDRPKGSGRAFQFERKAGTTGGQVYAVEKRNRITVRRVDRGAEQASEMPGGPQLVFLGDSVFALYIQMVPLATTGGQPLTALFPNGARRVAITAQRVTSGGGHSLVRVTGGIEAEIELGNDDQIQRISLPALRLEAVRRAN
jgi:hypothetical protein